MCHFSVQKGPTNVTNIFQEIRQLSLALIAQCPDLQLFIVTYEYMYASLYERPLISSDCTYFSSDSRGHVQDNPNTMTYKAFCLKYVVDERRILHVVCICILVLISNTISTPRYRFNSKSVLNFTVDQEQIDYQFATICLSHLSVTNLYIEHNYNCKFRFFFFAFGDQFNYSTFT